MLNGRTRDSSRSNQAKPWPLKGLIAGEAGICRSSVFVGGRLGLRAVYLPVSVDARLYVWVLSGTVCPERKQFCEGKQPRGVG